MVVDIFSPCGIYCNTCLWYKGIMKPKCLGCIELEGKPFWGECLTYICSQKHKIEHCGQCLEFPCKEFMSRYDPREGPENALMRAGLLAYREKFGDKEAIELLEQAENYVKTRD